MKLHTGIRRQRMASKARLAACGLPLTIALGFAGCGGGGASPPPSNPVPGLFSLSPASTNAGGPAFTLTVTGSSFISGSAVQWNGASRSTTFVSASQLTAAILPSDIANTGTAKVTVLNPAPGGGTSNSVTFKIIGPTIAALSPSSAVATGPAFTLTVNGSNFVSGSTVQWNGSARTTTFVNSNQLTAAISVSDINSPGTAQVTVTDPANVLSNSVGFTITPYTPPKISTTSLPTSEVDKSYNFGLAVVGGAPPFTWGLAANSPPLPLSLVLDSTTGRITGTVAASEVGNTISFTVQVADSSTTMPPPALSRPLHISAVGAGSLGDNNTCPGGGVTARTTFISNGTIRASISPYGDIDVYSFTLSQTTTNLTIETFAQQLDNGTNLTTRSDFLDTVLELLDSNCTVLALNDDISSPPKHIQDSMIVIGPNPFPANPPLNPADMPAPASLAPGTYYIRVRDFRGDGRPDLIYDLSLTGAD